MLSALSQQLRERSTASSSVAASPSGTQSSGGAGDAQALLSPFEGSSVLTDGGAGVQIISTYVVGDPVAELYQELLSGSRQPGSDVRHQWTVAALAHPCSKWEHPPPPEAGMKPNPLDSARSTSSLLPSSSSSGLLSSSSSSAAGRKSAAVSMGKGKAESYEEEVALRAEAHSRCHPCYTDLLVMTTATHLFFVVSKETDAQRRARESAALNRLAAKTSLPPAPLLVDANGVPLDAHGAHQSASGVVLPGFGSAAAGGADEGGEHSGPQSALSPRRGCTGNLAASATFSAGAALGMAPSSRNPAVQQQQPQQRGKQLAASGTFSSAAAPSSSTAHQHFRVDSMPLGSSPHGPGYASMRLAGVGAGEGDTGISGALSEADSTDAEADDYSERDTDTEESQQSGGRAIPGRAGRDRSSKAVTSSRARVGSVRAQTLGGRTASPKTLPGSASFNNALPPSSGAMRISKGNVGNHDDVNGHPASVASSLVAHQPAARSLKAMLRKIERGSGAGVGAGSGASSSSTASVSRARSGRSPSPLRVSLRRAREMSKRRRGEEVTDTDLYRDIDREYGGINDDGDDDEEGALEGDDGEEQDEIGQDVYDDDGAYRLHEHADAEDDHRTSMVAASVPGPSSLYVSASPTHSAAPSAAPSPAPSPSSYDAKSTPLHLLLKESLLGLARVVLGLGMQSLRLEFVSGNAVVLVTASKRLTNQMLVALQDLYALAFARAERAKPAPMDSKGIGTSDGRGALVIENDDLLCLQRITTQVFGAESPDTNLRAYEVIKLLQVEWGAAADGSGAPLRIGGSGGGGGGMVLGNTGLEEGSYFVASSGSSGPARIGSSLTGPQLPPPGGAPRLPLPGILTVLIVSEALVFLCEELVLFAHANDASLSQRARDSARAKNKQLHRLLREWSATTKEDDKRAAELRAAIGAAAVPSLDDLQAREAAEAAAAGKAAKKARGKNSKRNSITGATNGARDDGGMGGVLLRRYRVLAVEPLAQLAQVDQSSLLSASHAQLGKHAASAGFGCTFSVRVSFTFGRRATAFQRTVEQLRQWSFAVSDTTLQRLHHTLRLTR
jgi:hypothetical protein